MVTSEQSDPPDSVEEYRFDYYQKVRPIAIKKWRFYRDGKTWLVDDLRGVHKTVKGNVERGWIIIRCRLVIKQEGKWDIAYMSLE